MTLDQLQASLSSLASGGTELLNRAQFQSVFVSAGSEEEAKQHAILVAEENRCGVRFLGLEECYAVFTKKQTVRRTAL
jgi:tRNA pseudouridine-54 N-methylase